MTDSTRQQQQQQQRFPFLRAISSTSDIRDRKQEQQQQQPPPHSFISSAGHVGNQGTATGNTIPPIRGQSIAAAAMAAAMLPHSIAVANAVPVERMTTASSTSSSSSPFTSLSITAPSYRRAHSASVSASSDPTNRSPIPRPTNIPNAAVNSPAASTATFTDTATADSSSSISSVNYSSATTTTTTTTTATITATKAAAGLMHQEDMDPVSRPSPSLVIDTSSQANYSPGSFPESLIASNRGQSYYNHNNNSSNSSSHGSYGYLNGAYDSASTSQRSSREGDGIMEGDDGNGTHISFVYANEKRFSDFHSLFRSVPDDEKLIEDYGCALQKEILVQGRLYISENHVCFNANIFGWVTNLVIAFSEITAIEKRLTAFVIPNAISIVTTTNTKGHFFASFLSRDAAHDLLMAAWRKSFPCAANASVANYNNNTNNNSSNNNSNSYQRQNRSNVTVNDDDDYSNDAQSFISARGNSESRKNRHRRSFSNASQPWTGDENTEWAEDDAAEGKTNDGLRRKGSKRAVVKKLLKDVIGPIIPDEEQRNASLSPNSGNKRVGRPRSVSELPPRPTSFDCTGNRESIVAARSSLDQDSLPPVVQRARAGTESLPNRRGVTVVSSPTTTNASLSGTLTTRQSPPATPSPSSSFARVRTTCQCSKDGRHYANQYLSETYPGSVESLWKLLFDSQFAKGFLTSEAMKGADVQEESWKSSTDGTSSKVTRYTKWLGMPIGPKTTKAILTDVCEYKNFEEYVTTVTTTSTPDVPSGGSFTTKVRTCLTWAGPHQVQIVVTGAVEFTKSSWIKGQIEKGAAEGMTAHYKELDRCLRKYIADHPKDFPTGTDTGAATAVVGAARPPASVMKSAVKAGHGGAGPEKASRKEATSTPPSVSFDTRQTKDDKGSSLSTMAGQTKSVSVGSSLADFRSMLPKTLELEWNTHLALVSVLIMVLVANVYIWCQISNVSFQIEKFADGSHGHHHHHPEYQAGQQPYGTSRRRSVWTSSGATMLDDEEMDAFEREEAFAREQEEVMWAWLTEREARRREYMRASAVQRTESMSRPEERTGKVGTEVRLSETESKLQARIDDLEQQLEALERQAVVMRSKSEVLEKESSQSSFA